MCRQLALARTCRSCLPVLSSMASPKNLAPALEDAAGTPAQGSPPAKAMKVMKVIKKVMKAKGKACL